jgi:hypothetical protein
MRHKITTSLPSSAVAVAALMSKPATASAESSSPTSPLPLPLEAESGSATADGDRGSSSSLADLDLLKDFDLLDAATSATAAAAAASDDDVKPKTEFVKKDIKEVPVDEDDDDDEDEFFNSGIRARCNTWPRRLQYGSNSQPTTSQVGYWRRYISHIYGDKSQQMVRCVLRYMNTNV